MPPKNKKSEAKEASEEALIAHLDKLIASSNLAELHTHLMGMGSADFWVSRIMGVYLPRAFESRQLLLGNCKSTADMLSCFKRILSEYSQKFNGDDKTNEEVIKTFGGKFTFDVVYPVKKLIEACGIQIPQKHHDDFVLSEFVLECSQSILESKLFDVPGKAAENSHLMIKQYWVLDVKSGCFREERGISNNDLMKLAKSSKIGVLGIIRNWFEFLDASGETPELSDIRDTYRNNFTPKFYPQRFTIKDRIVEQYPEVLSILLNTVLHRYAKSGVKYVEFSVSAGDLGNGALLYAMRHLVFASKTRNIDDILINGEVTSVVPNLTTLRIVFEGGELEINLGELRKHKSYKAEVIEPKIEACLQRTNASDAMWDKYRSASLSSGKGKPKGLPRTMSLSSSYPSRASTLRDSQQPCALSFDQSDAKTDETLSVTTAVAASNKRVGDADDDLCKKKTRPRGASESGPSSGCSNWCAQSSLDGRSVEPPQEMKTEKSDEIPVSLAETVLSTVGSLNNMSDGETSGKLSSFASEQNLPLREQSATSGTKKHNLPLQMLPPERSDTLLESQPSPTSAPRSTSSDALLGPAVGRAVTYEVPVPTRPTFDMNRASKPFWRTLMGRYEEQADGQVYYFLAAFNRASKCKPPKTCDPAAAITVDYGEYVDPLTANFHLAKMAENRTDHEIMQIAEHLCTDGVLQEIYGSALDTLGDRKKQLEDPKYGQEFFTSVVGLDWVGDELGMPYCALAHSSFTNFVKWMWERNPRFGIRLHAGEGTIRPAAQHASQRGHALLKGAFKLHLYVLMAGIRKIHGKLRKVCKEEFVPLRIGHGVAFLYEPGDEDPEFKAAMDEFRKFLSDNRIVCELNPQSNFMLLSDTFVSKKCEHVTQTLKFFKVKKLPVVLCTDDDGIWAIHKCPEHHNHISVGYEYCQAIQRGDIETENVINEMAKLALDASFAVPKKVKKKEKE